MKRESSEGYVSDKSSSNEAVDQVSCEANERAGRPDAGPRAGQVIGLDCGVCVHLVLTCCLDVDLLVCAVLFYFSKCSRQKKRTDGSKFSFLFALNVVTSGLKKLPAVNTSDFGITP